MMMIIIIIIKLLPTRHLHFTIISGYILQNDIACIGYVSC